MTPLAWSILLPLVGAGGLYLTTRKLWYGYAVGLGVQLLWVTYAIVTVQWGFIGSALLYGWINILGIRSWRGNKEQKEATCQDQDPDAHCSPHESTGTTSGGWSPARLKKVWTTRPSSGA